MLKDWRDIGLVILAFVMCIYGVAIGLGYSLDVFELEDLREVILR